MICIKNILIFCAPNGKLVVAAGMKTVPYKVTQTPVDENIVIKDKDLYKEDDYFSKSPRMKRTIEEVDFKLNDAPDTSSGEKMPALLTVGPMFTMGLSSLLMMFGTYVSIFNGSTNIGDSWLTISTSVLMLLSSFVWPYIIQKYTNRKEKNEKREAIRKYDEYIERKEKELNSIVLLQKSILEENLLPFNECVNMISTKSFPFWNKRRDQDDFLDVRIGHGNEKLQIKLDSPKDKFEIEISEQQEKAEALKEKYSYIPDVPIGYSIFKNRISAIMGDVDKCYSFINSLIIQIISFYSYEDVKFVVFTDETKESNWEYIRYLNYSFSDDKSVRFFGSNPESSKTIIEYLKGEFELRKASEGAPCQPYYIIIVDAYDKIKRYNFIKDLTEANDNCGFSVIMLENRISKLPSKCNNFIYVRGNDSMVIKDAYEKQEQIKFIEEVPNNVDLMQIPKIVSNIPIEFENNVTGSLPDSLSFLEMEKVGKVEQLNILNKWRTNDSTSSLKAEIGVNNQGDIVYLDLHEKAHGPHGLIAGMTGSGKSEFIITYILSMAINYSPDDVSFILIDYKGGGLAGAFQNAVTGRSLPHLAGVITNLDKAEMNRTLVSITSELQRRQKVFNEARDRLGESTIDIYKYQNYYKSGLVSEPISHLFIVCDEFAELKSQQPDFMDSLISTARIGRSLGVHLILATQRPTGVVDDQIWSNTKFRVCLKVQDTSDSNEMLKKPDAASLKETGRFYLQVGYDEFYVLGQSAWCGAKYYPSDKLVKTVDKSVNFIDDAGTIIKSMQNTSTNKDVQSKGEQISAIMDVIIDVAKQTNKVSRKLWLDSIPALIYEENETQKYNYVRDNLNIEAILGEYDSPETQEQGIVKYNYIKDGNLAVYGNDSVEKEMFLKALIYTTTKYFTANLINYYIVDYGSESLRVFDSLPHVGGSVHLGEVEQLNSLLKLVDDEIKVRKDKFVNYGGRYENYIRESGEFLPIMAVVLNNYDSILENNQSLYDILPTITRDSERYGIVFIITCSDVNSMSSKLAQNFSTSYAYKLKEASDYIFLFNTRQKIVPREIVGRGVCSINGVHEFQTISLSPDDENKFLLQFIQSVREVNNTKARGIPSLPTQITSDYVKNYISNLTYVPIGIEKNTLSISMFNFMSNPGTIISSNKLLNTYNFACSLLLELEQIENNNLYVFDVSKKIDAEGQNITSYVCDDFETKFNEITELLNTPNEDENKPSVCVFIYDLDKLINKVSDYSMILDDLSNAVKAYGKACVIVVDGAPKLKPYEYETWYSSLFGQFEGIWVGKGVSDQSTLRIGNVEKEMMGNYKNDMGFVITENVGVLIKLIDFFNKAGDNNEK
jgi:S-DNA-T family DNA segregation ATPase FtsK/SpoIIIE